VRRSQGWIHDRDSSVGIKTSYMLVGPGSILPYFQFFISSVFLCTTYFLTYQYFSILYYCYSFCILYYLCITVYVLFVLYVPAGIGPNTVGNEYSI
jgi:hypothetical protein